MQPLFILWLERDGEVVLSLWRVQLLQAVADTGSISGAAEALDVGYRVAWQKIHEMEERLGEKLVETQIGGAQGGGATLTPTAVRYVEQFGRFSHDMEQHLTDAFNTHFGR